MRIEPLVTLATPEEPVFARVYAALQPDSSNLPRGRRHHAEHFSALDLLGQVLAKDFGLHHVRLERDSHGKPCLLHDSLYCNLAHCRGLLVCAVARSAVGIDAEPPRAASDAMRTRICTEAEQRCLADAVAPDWTFAKLWTLKESYGKYCGAGIRLPLQRLEFALPTTEKKTMQFCYHKKQKQPSVSLFQILLPVGLLGVEQSLPYAIALCCAKQASFTTYFHAFSLALSSTEQFIESEEK